MADYMLEENDNAGEDENRPTPPPPFIARTLTPPPPLTFHFTGFDGVEIPGVNGALVILDLISPHLRRFQLGFD
ncbi:hypothetical protein L1987_60918 [Smallanthus sonchifolius]|uniref:Uncharacterized protein n=1 Tax=Smallanthus sonchifolius TaxID=185202 RepID=A0ACB9D9E9_9ASTR|nr:hypothetical protein L1987_60918 [Smallanthus sonchifolius]